MDTALDSERKDRSDLTSGTVWRKLLVFFLPIAAGTCIQQLYNAVDGLVVGRYVGTVALAAVGGSTSQIINLIIGFFVSLTAGASVVIAQIFGAGHREDVSRVSGCAVLFCTVAGIALAVFGIVFAPMMLRLMKTPADTFPGALLYLRIYFGGVPFVLILNMESNMLRAVGNSMDPFLYMVAGCVTNIILDFAFVLFFGWGVAGVAIATVLAQVINMALLTRNLLKTEKAYRLNVSDLKIHRLYLKSMLHLGIPSGLQSSMYAVSNMIIQIGINTLGTVVVASWAMSSKVDGLYWGISNALGAAVTSFAGQNMGAGKPERIRQCARQGTLMALLLSVVLSAALMLLGRPILGILTEDKDVIDTTYLVMKYIVPYYFTWAAIEVLSAIMRGSGDAVKPVVIIGLSICLLRIVWIATVFRSVGSLMILCLSYPLSWVVCCICLMIRYLRGSWLREPGKRIYN